LLEGGAELHAPIYTLELLGDSTMVTVRSRGELVSVKAPKDFRAEIGDAFTAHIPASICHVFDATTGARL
jgi:multiple sugar transport system ATP-binding protein